MVYNDTFVLGIFLDPTSVVNALRQFRDAGFVPAEISVLQPDTKTPEIAAMLVRAGVRESDALSYEARVQRGEILISITCGGRERTVLAAKILDDMGADDIVPWSDQAFADSAVV